MKYFYNGDLRNGEKIEKLIKERIDNIKEDEKYVSGLKSLKSNITSFYKSIKYGIHHGSEILQMINDDIKTYELELKEDQQELKNLERLQKQGVKEWNWKS